MNKDEIWNYVHQKEKETGIRFMDVNFEKMKTKEEIDNWFEMFKNIDLESIFGDENE